jgi:hypothetical protein
MFLNHEAKTFRRRNRGVAAWLGGLGKIALCYVFRKVGGRHASSWSIPTQEACREL